jgi:hypothetical protein
MKFGILAYSIARQNSCLIIPAKWQCKGDKTKEMIYTTFRENVVPHMSDIVYYLDSIDVFVIAELSGITYYITDRNNIYNVKNITNICSLNKNYNDNERREFIQNKNSLHNKGQHILDKIDYTNGVFKPSDYKLNKLNFYSNALITGVGDFKIKDGGIQRIMSVETGKLQLLSIGEVNTKEDVELGIAPHDNYNLLFSSDNIDEIKSFMSFAYTKFVRFLIFNSIAGLRSVGQDTWWRFVPNQEFNHQFSDEELYRKYNLSDDDIRVIEETITERSISDVYSWI